MAKKCKIYIKHPHGLSDFLWANTSSDGSVVLGTASSYGGRQITHAILENGKAFRDGDFFTGQSLSQSKITFHASGYYKVSTIVGKTRESLDRCTIKGPPLFTIKEPRRMIEIILPNKLKNAAKNPTKRDIVINAEKFLNRPYKCLVWCADMKYFNEWSKEPTRIIDTSIIESSMDLEAGNRAWVFTLRQDNTDKHTNNEFTFIIPGEMTWGHITNCSKLTR